jgi:S1-C subfamily serine protease
MPGLWRVEVRRPEGTSLEVPVSFCLEAFVAPSVPARTDERTIGTDPQALAGSGGTELYDIPEDDWKILILDVLPGTHAFDLEVSAGESDIDLYVARHRPVDLQDANWSFASWKEGDSDSLYPGGIRPLPVGRYWIRVVHHAGDDDGCTLSWKRWTGPRPEASNAESIPCPEGVAVPIAYEDNVPFAWFTLETDKVAGAHVQVLFSDKDVDLVLARGDTGEVIARAESERNDEYIRVDPSLVLPSGTPLLAGVYRWSVAGKAEAGDLHLYPAARDRAAVAPTGYLPPYSAWKDDPYDRALAAAVEITTEDGFGSGVVVSPGGLILTCHHVIEEGGEILVAFPRGQRGRPRQAFCAKVIHEDAELDLALLKIEEDVFGRRAEDVRNLTFVPVGHVEQARLGDPLRVVAYGNSGSSRFGSNLTFLAGVVAGFESEYGVDRWLLTDARLGDGNSGGGYFNARYELIAIHNMAVGDEGSSLSYARPVSLLPEEWCHLIREDGGLLLSAEAAK